jgi:hypothetical protein
MILIQLNQNFMAASLHTVVLTCKGFGKINFYSLHIYYTSSCLDRHFLVE